MRIPLYFKFYIILLIFITTPSTSKCQNDSDERKVEVNPYSEKPAEFPGGQNALICYIEDQLAKQLLEISDEGTIILTATLDKKGKMKNIQFNFGDISKVPERMNPISNKTLEDEVRRVFLGMPAWTPEMQNDRPVQTDISWPIKFPYEQKCEKKN
tara:strand:- start:13253 stop:13720 length:468 start_codon:yes stop_codon:yes gene_type:complete